MLICCNHVIEIIVTSCGVSVNVGLPLRLCVGFQNGDLLEEVKRLFRID